MPLITFHVDEETKAAMDSRPEVDWSELLRRSIHDHLAGLRRQNRVEALLIMERISSRVKVPKGSDSSKVIRHWRDRRFRKGAR